VWWASDASRRIWMSPRSVAMVTSKTASGAISIGGAEAIGPRYRRRAGARSAGHELALGPQARDAGPDQGDEHRGGPLEPPVAVVDPVAGAGVEQAEHGLGDEAGGGRVLPALGDAVEPGLPGLLHGGVGHPPGPVDERPGGLVVAGEHEVPAHDAPQLGLVGQAVVERLGQL